MPQIWKNYERVRGITLTRESFQFIFELETDILTAMKYGFWTFDDWGMVLDRWVENPPVSFLKTAPVWIRIHKIVVNYFTLDMVDAIASTIGEVKEIAYDPERPHLNEFVRVLIILNLDQPVRDTKTVNLHNGSPTTVEVEYERIRKKCFHCMRLSHEKQRCHSLHGQRNRGYNGGSKQTGAMALVSHGRQHHSNLAEKIMPLLAPTIPPGFEPLPNVVVPKVFNKMRIYVNCMDPEERRIREHRMTQTLNDLSKDPVVQRSYLRLENPPIISKDLEKNKGKVYDFSKTQPDQSYGIKEAETVEVQLKKQNLIKEDGNNDKGNSTCLEALNILHTNMTPDQREGSGSFVPEPEVPQFKMGMIEASSSGISEKSRNSRRRTPLGLGEEKALMAINRLGQ